MARRIVESDRILGEADAQCNAAFRAFTGGFRLSNKGGGMHRHSIGTATLTTRERDVLRLLVDGHTNGEIARKLGIREQTVKDYVSVLFRKLHVRNRVTLAVAAVRAGF
jgi:DNA-binding NarL/FixJ family response regulator